MAGALILHSPLPRASCVERLQAALKGKGSGLVGRADEASLYVQKARNPWSRDIGAWRRLAAEIEDGPGGTRLRVWIRPFYELLIFAALWTFGLGQATASTGSLAPLALMLLGLLGLGLGWKMSEREGQAYLDFLRDTVQALPA